MAILTADLLYKYSVTTGPGNSTSGIAAGSLGEFISTTQITSASLNNLFDDMTGDENAALDDEYRCVFIHNANGSLTWEDPVLWISAEVAGGADATIGVDPTAASVLASETDQAVEIATESDVPGSVDFTGPTTKGTGLALGDLAAGKVKAFWFKRLGTDSAALDNDGITVRAEGDTAA